MLALVLAVALPAAVVLPHRLDLDRATPAVAVSIWLSALALRALTAIFVAVVLVWYLPATQLFSLVTHWCWHAVIPFVADHLMLTGHAVGDAALIAPSILLAVSVLSVARGLWLAARRIQTLVKRASIGRGPGDSVVLDDRAVVVAAAGLMRPQVVISAGALVAFDDDELQASLEHEHGHIDRGHRFLLVFAEVCGALGRPLPGTSAAVRELGYHLERDADHYSVKRTHQPVALASAICKSATSQFDAAPATSLNGGPVARRVRALLSDAPALRGVERALLRGCALAMALLVLAAVSALPAAIAGGVQASERSTVVHCQG